MISRNSKKILRLDYFFLGSVKRDKRDDFDVLHFSSIAYYKIPSKREKKKGGITTFENLMILVIPQQGCLYNGQTGKQVSKQTDVD